MTENREWHLLAQLASDDLDRAQSAFTAIYKAHWPKLLRGAITQGWVHDVPRAECEEIAHDSIAQLWFQRDIPLTPPLGAFLRALAKRRILNARRNAQSEDRFLAEHYARCGYTPAYDDQGNLLWSGPFADARTLYIEVLESFGSALNAMAVQRRNVLIDAYCDDLTVAESIDLRTVSQQTIKNLRHRGRHELMRSMQDAGHTPSE